MLITALVVAAGFAFASAVLAVRARRLGRELEDSKLRAQELATRAETLAKYQPIVDAEAHAAKVVEEAQHRANTILADANGRAAVTDSAAQAAAGRLREEALREAATQRTTAEQQLRGAENEADKLRTAAREKLNEAAARVEEARTAAADILDRARARAEEIAGVALKAQGNAKLYESTAEAMKNVIEGYGDRYIIPTFSVLDSLADEYGFDEAGKKLKAARDHTRWMVKEGKAATCDYVEERRRNTAIDFVIDAFNGKVDTVLSGVKKDNFGTLEQKIRDAFALVNFNGEAFRNARITEDYLDARLQELRWAVAVQELREREKEEQREIRERIREEEKARREYERAMKEAAKEEEALLKLRAKVEAEVEKASAEQRAKYEKQLEEVNARLRAAEEKNQRAMSMAQQTRAGHVYVISNEGSLGENVLKIGLTRRLEPLDRIKELGDASVPFEFDVHALIRSDDAPTLERELHKLFVQGQVNKVNARKEFFRVSVGEVREAVERLGLAATWTMAAAAREYRETLAIERAMKEKKLDVNDWAKKQEQEHDAGMLTTAALETEPA